MFDLHFKYCSVFSVHGAPSNNGIISLHDWCHRLIYCDKSSPEGYRNPYNCLLKNANFPMKKKQQQLNNIYHLIANLLLLWMISRWFFVSVKNDFSGQAWKCKSFPVTRRYWCRCDHCLLIYKTVSQFFEILILSRCFWANVNHAREIIFISSGNLINAFYLPSNRKRNLRHGSVEER